MPSIRSFIALPSSPELNNALQNIQKLLMEERADVKWDGPNKFHITLKFLGKVDDQQLPEILESLTAIAAEATPFPLVYNAIGAFPDFVHPKVIWAGAQVNDAMTFLQREIEDACEKLKFAGETRTFHPHITLGRVKGSNNLARLTARVKSITFEPIETTCAEVLLIKSDLRPTGSVYTTLNSFPLKA